MYHYHNETCRECNWREQRRRQKALYAEIVRRVRSLIKAVPDQTKKSTLCSMWDSLAVEITAWVLILDVEAVEKLLNEQKHTEPLHMMKRKIEQMLDVVLKLEEIFSKM